MLICYDVFIFVLAVMCVMILLDLDVLVRLFIAGDGSFLHVFVIMVG